jgi:hypothetical protein
MPYGTAAISRTNGYIPNVGPSAFLIPGQFFYANKLNLKGVINLGVNPFIQHGPTDLITIADSNSEKTGATPGNRPTADANDTAIGIDGTYDGFGLRGKTSISQYIGSRFDGTSWLERLTSTSKTFAVPIKASSYAGTGAATFTAGTAAGSSPGTPTCAPSHICDSFSGTLSFTVGISTNTGALLTVTTGATRLNQPSCTGRAYLMASPYTELPVRLTYTNSTIVFNVGTAPTPNKAYELVYAACGGN